MKQRFCVFLLCLTVLSAAAISGCGKGKKTDISVNGTSGPENADVLPSAQDTDGYIYYKTDDWVIAMDDVNIRTASTSYSDSAGVLKKGETIHRVAENESWSKVEFEDGIYYIATAFLKPSSVPDNEKPFKESAEVTDDPDTDNRDEKTAGEEPGEEKTAEEETTDEKKAEEKTTQEKEAEKETAEEKLTEEETTEEKLTEEETTEGKSGRR